MAREVYYIPWKRMSPAGEDKGGYSLHTTPNAARAYLQRQFNGMPETAPDSYDVPADGFVRPIYAQRVTIQDGNPLALAMGDKTSLRVAGGTLLREELNLSTVSSAKVLVSEGFTRLDPGIIALARKYRGFLPGAPRRQRPALRAA